MARDRTGGFCVEARIEGRLKFAIIERIEP
jgi:hypothetical protein